MIKKREEHKRQLGAHNLRIHSPPLFTKIRSSFAAQRGLAFLFRGCGWFLRHIAGK
ncbi:hypothetical protein BC940DRAFT_300270 [Gongronella butleri]|nr:hypothetical protein BC940DRAFT_300270 [Gongronella butleri]